MMATGRASAQGRRTPRVRMLHSRPATSETPSRASFLVDVPVVDEVPGDEGPGHEGPRDDAPGDDDAPRTEPPPGPSYDVGDEPTDDELDARARAVLEGLPRLEDLLAARVPVTLVADLLSPFGPDSERIAREEQGR